MHRCVNVSWEPEGQAAWFVRAARELTSGLASMARRRNLSLNARPRLLASGPGRLCQAMAITRAEHNGLDLTCAASPLALADDGFSTRSIEATPRIGIRQAADRLLRFTLRGNSYLSA